MVLHLAVLIQWRAYQINTTGESGIQDNYPGTSYRITWGDNATDILTHCQLVSGDGILNHNYKKTSCGQPPINIGNGNTIQNSYNVSATSINPFCQSAPATVSIYPKIYTKPIAQIDPNSATTACINTPIVFANKSTKGNNADCSPNMSYAWYVDGVLVSTAEVYTHPGFPTSGVHLIKLVASNDVEICRPSEDVREICIQAPPQPSFNFSGNAGATSCAPATLKPTNTSIIDANCNTNNTYQWSVSGGTVGYANGTSAASKEPEFNFTTPGVYKVVLSVTTASCGLFSTPEQTVIINGPPVATLSPDIELCTIGTYNFNNTTAGPTNTVLSGTQEDLPTTYTWTVTGGAYSFETGSTEHSKYPNIIFTEYKTYTVTVTHTNSCGTVSDSQLITFTPSPVVDAGPDQSICFKDTAPLNATITGSVTSNIWVGGSGTFAPNRNTLNAIYTPTAAERTSGQVTLTLRVTTTLAAPCNTIDNDIIITIKPEITITSPPTTSICTGTTLSYPITANLSGTTYTWTATGSGNASGFAATGSGNTISEPLTNTDPINNATVTYVITPSNNGCTGDPFTLTATITPNPVITAVPANPTVCNNQPAGITLTSNLGSTTQYTWTSTVTGNVTGNSSSPVPASATAINDVLFNSGNTSGTVTYTITPISANNCSGSPVVVTITVEPSVTIANAGPDQNVCSTSTYTLNANDPGVGTGKWTLTSGQTGITFADDTKYNTTVSGLQNGVNYTFRWTITGSPSCPVSFDDVTIMINQITVGGTTTGTATVCGGNNGGTIDLSGQTGEVINWESSTDNGLTWQPLTSTATSYAYSNLAVTTQFRAVVKNGDCPALTSTATTITVTAGTVIANAGTDQVLCNSTAVTLTGNDPLPNPGTWSLVSGQTGVTINSPSSATTTVSGLTGGQTYIFRWTISGNAPCPPTTDDVTISDLAPITNSITNSTPAVCSGQTITVTGSQPTGGNNTYTYVWESSNDNGATWTVINGQTDKDLTLVLTETLDFRRTVNSGNCSSTSSSIHIIAQPPITNNVISSNQNICTGNAPAPLTGTTPSGGDGNYNYQWQSSIDNGTTWSNITNATASGYTPSVLTSTIAYRRLVNSIQCSGSLQSISNTVTITVNPDAIATFTWVSDSGCAPFTLDAQNIVAEAHPDRNATYTWYADNVQIGTSITFPGRTISTNNTSVVIKLVVTSSFGCLSAEMSHTFKTQQNVVASFTQDVTKGCGNTTVKFTNTTPVIAGAIYDWDFGNGNHSNLMNPPPQVYLPDPAGNDVTYAVKLTVTTNCGSNTSPETSLLIQSKPIARVSPDKTSGCLDLTVVFNNTSPDSKNTTYIYDFGDGSPVIPRTDRTPVTYTYTTAGTYKIKMTATNDCGTDVSPEISINVIPNTAVAELVVNANEQQGCAPHTVNFINNSSGAISYTYDYGDGSPVEPYISNQNVVHKFTRGGTFTVTLTAFNNCGGSKSTTENITVYDQPTAVFDADQKLGCPGMAVQFRNNSVGAISYVWDFGDGSTSTAFEPNHTYTGAQEYYTVTLTAVNSLGCPGTSQQIQFIHIVPPPVATFNVLPSTLISIPNYTFKFEDESTGTPDQWQWTFGDGGTSNIKNPSHTYPDTGSYKVTLRVTNQQGCFTNTFKTVRITGVPGYLYIPNSFMPSSATSELREFKAKGSGIASWKMTIFNKWGLVLWETTKLDEGKPAEGWDGTYHSQPVQQGVYYWKIEVDMINGTPWKGMSYDGSAPKRTGVINLIR